MLGALVAPWLLSLLGASGLLLGLAVGCAVVLGWGLRRTRPRRAFSPAPVEGVKLAA